MEALLLTGLPTDILYAIVARVPSASDASSLGATCLSMHHVYERLVAGRRHRALTAAALRMGTFVDDWERFAAHYDDELFLCNVDEDRGDEYQEEEDAPLTDARPPDRASLLCDDALVLHAVDACEPKDASAADDTSTSDTDDWSLGGGASTRCFQLPRTAPSLAGVSIEPCTDEPDWSLDVNLPDDGNCHRNYMCDACARLAGRVLDDPDHVKWPMVRIDMDRPHVWTRDWAGICPAAYVPTPPVGELRAPRGLESWIDAEAAQCLADSIHVARSIFDATFAPYLDGYVGPVPLECDPARIIYRSSLIPTEADGDGDAGEQRPAMYVTRALHCSSYYKWHADENGHGDDGVDEGRDHDSDYDHDSIDGEASDDEMQVVGEATSGERQHVDETSDDGGLEPSVPDGDDDGEWSGREDRSEGDKDTISSDDDNDRSDNEDVDGQRRDRSRLDDAMAAARKAGRDDERERWESRDDAGRPVAVVTIDASEGAPRQDPFVGFDQYDRFGSCLRYCVDNVPPAALVRVHHTLPSVVGNPRAWLPIGATRVPCRRPERGYIWRYVLVCCDPSSPMWGAAMVVRAMTDRWPSIVWLPGADDARAAIETYRRDHHHRRQGPARALGVREGFVHWLCTSRRLPAPSHWKILRDGAIKAGQPAVPTWTGFPRFDRC
ncbi:hypothetical protein [Pandoravirus japonicus]|uniref:F-box domain containing protein n=1 Tax=Pandoravirus japonicus TaxID=2823154 RepID=A0A811BLJ1_9VIRU|nr:hypothetical protein [Pandoravirus japonicus]